MSRCCVLPSSEWRWNYEPAARESIIMVKLHGLQSASHLHRLRDRHRSANFSAKFVDRGVLRGQRGGSPTVVNLCFLDRSRYFSFKKLHIYPHKG
jgi:hypothetical protein